MEKGTQIIKKVNRILFLSADDFKEKSIQVIRKTPEAYVAAGWEVYYIVMRDSSKKGNYFYERPLDIAGAHIIRREVPGTKLLNGITNRYLASLIIRIRRYIGILYLIRYGIKFSKDKEIDILYGYEQPGAVAAKFIKSVGFLRDAKLVLRFQGVVFVKEWIKQNKWYRKITNFDTYYALKGPSDLCIMTNDGSCGDWVLQQVGAKHKKIAFLSNGVDQFIIDDTKRTTLVNQYKSADEYLFVSVSRLDDHKRVDRCIRFFDKVVKNNPEKVFKYLIVGEGAKRVEFEALVVELNISKYIEFIGAVNQSEVPLYLDIADVFISMYESSNVGNPLLEAIRLNKFIITLDNGGTGEWIKHRETGFLYPVNDSLDLGNSDYENMKNDFLEVLENPSQITNMKENLKVKEKEKLWSWEDRFKAEVLLVDELIA